MDTVVTVADNSGRNFLLQENGKAPLREVLLSWRGLCVKVVRLNLDCAFYVCDKESKNNWKFVFTRNLNHKRRVCETDRCQFRCSHQV